MPKNSENISKRKKEHLEICLKEDVSFKIKTNGFDNYEFEHCAVTEVEINKIDFVTDFLNKSISYPFLISSMTGGTHDSIEINEHLATAARELNIPIGVGSQRQLLENNEYLKSFKVIKQKAGSIPVLGNIGAAQIVLEKEPQLLIKKLTDMIEADAMIIHLNPLQELFQVPGNTSFKGLIKAIDKISNSIPTPLIVKEVGAGISGSSARRLLEAGVKGIDVAGAGGTSWSAVEMIRNNEFDDYFRDWGLPTTYCINEVKKLKDSYSFSLIASGGVNSGIDVAKSLALGADMAASAKTVLKTVVEKGSDGVVELIRKWFNIVAKIMYLTGAQDLNAFSKVKIIKKEDIY